MQYLAEKKIQGALTTADANLLRCVRQNVVWLNVVCLERGGVRFQHILYLQNTHDMIIGYLAPFDGEEYHEN
jgi:hypothetical protein